MKKILAMAIAAGLSAPVMAETTVYGQMDASVDFLSSDGNDDKTSVSSNSSRIGVKGSADLSNGLKAIYQAEWGIDTGGANGTPGNGSSTFSNRNQVVGIAGGFGAVLIGRHDTPMKTIGRKADLFWSEQLGTNYNITNPRNWDIRANNVVAYQTPKMGGLQMLGAYVTDIAGTNDATAFSVNGIYSAGPLMLGAAYETHDVDGAGDQNAYRLMGSYKVGPATLVAMYQDETNDPIVSSVTGGTGSDATVWGIGASYKMGPGLIKGQYYERDNDSNALSDPDLLAIGYDYSLGKDTVVYGQYAKVTEANGFAANGAQLGGFGHGESASSAGDADGFSVGVRHKF